MRDDKFISKWEHSRKKGKTLYIVHFCILMVSSTLVGIAIVHLITGKISIDITIGVIIGELIGCIIGGILNWRSSEEKYKNLTGAEPD